MTGLLQEWVTAQADQRPEATAGVLNHERMTYAQLERLSNQVARVLKEGGCERGDRVCLLMPKSPVTIATLLGALKADCMWIPLDPSGPASRLARIVESCAPRFLSGKARFLILSWVPVPRSPPPQPADSTALESKHGLNTSQWRKPPSRDWPN